MTADSAAPSGSRPPAGPRHVAIIMDGNGRWAKARGLPRAVGHREGVQALKRTIQAAPDLGIQCLTVFGFSTENWSRPPDEVSDLMGLLSSSVLIHVIEGTHVFPMPRSCSIAEASHDAAHRSSDTA